MCINYSLQLHALCHVSNAFSWVNNLHFAGLNEYNHDDREGSVDDISAQYSCTLSTISDASEPSVGYLSSWYKC